ncbi:MAG: hypothetical protein JXA69_16110, partial [Phycisphaerae bacterium]|nr:hypothetical protein [Phycisphaerae bacterium]
GAPSRLLVHLPPHERGAVEGLDAAGAAQAAPQAWDDADALVIVGNPFATHPVSARRLIRWRQTHVMKPVIVIDSAAGMTAQFAPYHVICRPGYEYHVVNALLTSAGASGTTDRLPGKAVAQRTINGSGVDSERVNRAAMQLRSAQRPAVVLAPSSGRADVWRALSHAAADWASQRGGTCTVLTGSANALAISRYMRQHDLADWSETCAADASNEPHVLLVVGWDPSSAYPRAIWGPAVHRAQHVVLATAFPPAEADWVDQVLPLALPPEAGGTYILAAGQPCKVEPLMTPPAGIPSVRELFHAIGERAGIAIVGPALDVAASGARVPDVPAPQPPSAQATGTWPAVLVADPTQYFDGQITRHSRWCQQLRLNPELWVSPADAGQIGLVNGQEARIRNAQGEAIVRIVIAADQPAAGGCAAEVVVDGNRPVGWLAVSGSFAEIRRLGDAEHGAWDGTIHIDVEPLGHAPGVEEAAHANA